MTHPRLPKFPPDAAKQRYKLAHRAIRLAKNGDFLLLFPVFEGTTDHERASLLWKAEGSRYNLIDRYEHGGWVLRWTAASSWDRLKQYHAHHREYYESKYSRKISLTEAL